MNRTLALVLLTLAALAPDARAGAFAELAAAAGDEQAAGAPKAPREHPVYNEAAYAAAREKRDRAIASCASLPGHGRATAFEKLWALYRSADGLDAYAAAHLTGRFSGCGAEADEPDRLRATALNSYAQLVPGTRNLLTRLRMTYVSGNYGYPWDPGNGPEHFMDRAGDIFSAVEARDAEPGSVPWRPREGELLADLIDGGRRDPSDFKASMFFYNKIVGGAHYVRRVGNALVVKTVSSSSDYAGRERVLRYDYLPLRD